MVIFNCVHGTVFDRMHCESAERVRGERMWFVGAEADSEPRIYTTVFDITGTRYKETAISCTWNKLLLNKMYERGQRTRITGCYTVQRSRYPLNVEITSLSDLITFRIYGSHITKYTRILNMAKISV
jgi:hypothetical protein